jgi:hypothetical protein
MFSQCLTHWNLSYERKIEGEQHGVGNNLFRWLNYFFNSHFFVFLVGHDLIMRGVFALSSPQKLCELIHFESAVIIK